MQRAGKSRHVLDAMCGMCERSTTCVGCITADMSGMNTTDKLLCVFCMPKWQVFPPGPAREVPRARLRQLPPPLLRTNSRRRVCGSSRRRACAPAPAVAFAAASPPRLRASSRQRVCGSSRRRACAPAPRLRASSRRRGRSGDLGPLIFPSALGRRLGWRRGAREHRVPPKRRRRCNSR